MIKYLHVVRSLVSNFLYQTSQKYLGWKIHKQINWKKYASIAIPNLKKFEEQILVEFLPIKSTDLKMIEVLPVQTVPYEEILESFAVQVSWDNWMTPFLDYLKHGILPTDKKEAKSLI